VVFPFPASFFWDFLMGDSTYQDMLSNKKTENKKDAKREVLSKFGKTNSSGSVEYFYSNVTEFKNIFRRNFSEAYRKYKDRLEEVHERFTKVMEKHMASKRDYSKEKRVVESLSFIEKINKYANLETLNSNQLQDLKNSLEEQKKNLSGGGKDRLRKVIGQQNLKKLTTILKNSIKDSNVSVQDFFKDRVIFNKALIVIGIENIEGIVYAKKVGDFKKFTANSNKFKSKNKIKENLTLYGKVVDIPVRKKIEQEEFLSKFVDKDGVRLTFREGFTAEARTQKRIIRGGKKSFKDIDETDIKPAKYSQKAAKMKANPKARILFYVDYPELYELLVSSDEKLQNKTKIGGYAMEDAELTKLIAENVEEKQIETYFNVLRASKMQFGIKVRGEKRAKRQLDKTPLLFKINNEKIDNLMFQKGAKGARKLEIHPFFEQLLTTSGSDAFFEASKGLSKRTARYSLDSAKATAARKLGISISQLDDKQLAETEKEYNELVGDENFEEFDAEVIKWLFSKENLEDDTFEDLYGKFRTQNLDTQNTDDKSKYLIRAGNKYITTNKELGNFIKRLEPLVRETMQEEESWDEDDEKLGEFIDELEDLEPITADDFSSEIAKAFYELLVSLPKDQTLGKVISKTNVENLLSKKMDKSQAFAVALYTVELLFPAADYKKKVEVKDLDADENEIVVEADRPLKEIVGDIARENLSLENESLKEAIEELANKVNEDLNKIRELFKKSLKKKLEDIANRPENYKTLYYDENLLRQMIDGKLFKEEK